MYNVLKSPCKELHFSFLCIVNVNTRILTREDTHNILYGASGVFIDN